MNRLGIAIAVSLLAGCPQVHDGGSSPAEEELNTGETPTSVPVLELPERYMSGAAFMTGERWYAINYEGDGLVIHLHGTNAHVDRPADVDPEDLEHNAEVRGIRAFDTTDEGIRVISWMENGASYSLDVTCTRQDDERCAESDFAVALAGQLEARP